MSISRKICIRLLCILLGVLLIVFLALPAGATNESVAAYTWTARVYRSDSLESTVIGQLLNGTFVEVLGSSGKFYLIDCDPLTGYIPKSQLSYHADIGYYVNLPIRDCDPAQPETLPAGVAAFPLWDGIDATIACSSLVRTGASLLGTPYVYGGMSPRGFDCSGFVSYLFRQQDIALHRCADEQMQDGLIVKREQLQVGDLVFFRCYGPWLASHVGIYVGDGQMIHAGSDGIEYADLDSPYWADSYVGARRIFAASTSLSVESLFFSASAIDLETR